MTDDLEHGAELPFCFDHDTTSVTQASLNGRSSSGTRPAISRQMARFLAVERDAELARSLDLSRLWLELCRGTWVFRDTFSTDNRCFALLEPVSVFPPRPLKASKLQILERLLLGETPKVVAIEQQRAISSVAAASHDCLQRMGLTSRRLSQATVLLTMAACAALRPQHPPTSGRLSHLKLDGEDYLVVSVLRPDLTFPVPLSRAEAAVVRELVAGRSHAQISDLRATSLRTVANQLATVFKKFGVSGRGAIVHQLIQHSLERQRAASYAAELRA
ncbi:MAG TPA: LuxR C-terminal-related transcriptional regulator [Polyangiaceae bacterium]|jgi:DNA-binding NarL/FixJ family response regulator